jgi:hypothetical protein
MVYLDTLAKVIYSPQREPEAIYHALGIDEELETAESISITEVAPLSSRSWPGLACMGYVQHWVATGLWVWSPFAQA